jgi:alkylation response protein AidB-like acyl-CoA dehydrogenase
LPNARGRAVDFARTLAAGEAAGAHCANVLVASELATAAVWDSARAAAGGNQQFSLTSAVAAAQAMPASPRNSQLNIQVHGDIGYTWEHDAHMLLRRSASLAALFEPRRRQPKLPTSPKLGSPGTRVRTFLGLPRDLLVL